MRFLENTTPRTAGFTKNEKNFNHRVYKCQQSLKLLGNRGKKVGRPGEIIQSQQ